jgi:hypothetical protein
MKRIPLPLSRDADGVVVFDINFCVEKACEQWQQERNQIQKMASVEVAINFMVTVYGRADRCSRRRPDNRRISKMHKRKREEKMRSEACSLIDADLVVFCEVACDRLSRIWVLDETICVGICSNINMRLCTEKLQLFSESPGVCLLAAIFFASVGWR